MDMQMPQPGPEHENLAKLAGNWAGEETMFPSPWSPEQQTRHGVIKAHVLENFFVVSDYEQKTDDQVCFRGHGVYSWDPQNACYKMYWFDSMGGAGGIAEGHFEGDVLTFENTSPMGRHRYRYTFHADHTVFEMAMAPEGEDWAPMMEATYRQVG